MQKQTAEKQEPTIVNGVDVDQLFGNIDAIKDAPVLGKFKFRANNKWINGGHNQTTINNFHVYKKNTIMPIRSNWMRTNRHFFWAKT